MTKMRKSDSKAQKWRKREKVTIKRKSDQNEKK